MNEAALLEEVKPLLDRMAKGSGNEYCTIQLSFRRHAAERFVFEAGAYVDSMQWNYGDTIADAAAPFIEGSPQYWKERADEAAAVAETARLEHERLLNKAGRLRSKALSMQPTPAGAELGEK